MMRSVLIPESCFASCPETSTHQSNCEAVAAAMASRAKPREAHLHCRVEAVEHGFPADTAADVALRIKKHLCSRAAVFSGDAAWDNVADVDFDAQWREEFEAAHLP
jgi:hypothetical protein